MKFRMELFRITFVVSFMLSISNTAHAYLGPGAGLGMMGSLIALVIAILVIVLGLVIYPIRCLLKRRSKSNQS